MNAERAALAFAVAGVAAGVVGAVVVARAAHAVQTQGVTLNVAGLPPIKLAPGANKGAIALPPEAADALSFGPALAAAAAVVAAVVVVAVV